MGSNERSNQSHGMIQSPLEILSPKSPPDASVERVGTLHGRPAVKPTAGRRARRVDWHALLAKCKAWARHPLNAAQLVWLAFVAAGLVFVLLLMAGALDAAVPDAARRRRWAEAGNQVLNALFTVVCIYYHPQLCHHLVLLCRWRAADTAGLRGAYCKKRAASGYVAPPRERLHLAVVVLLLHATCLAQYGYCALFWVYSSAARPDWAVDLCMGVGCAAPIVSGLYALYGPLGRKIVLPAEAADDNEELAEASATAPGQCNSGGSAIASKAGWAGGLFDVGDDLAVAGLSLSCTFCVFGWNMERLGFGDMYVHACTFLLLCAAPLLVFGVGALKVHGGALRYAFAAAGALLAFLGLLYGGFWRARIRRRLGLPAERSTCCGRPAAADYAKWLLCGPCALAQEVRTANLYVDVEEGGLCPRGEDEAAARRPAMAPLNREGSVALVAMAGDGGGRMAAMDVAPAPVRVETSMCA